MTLIQATASRITDQPGTIGHLLNSGLRSLDITLAEHRAVEERYLALGTSFEEHWQDTRSTNTVFPQGSFALGTVTRRVHHGDDIDIDLVASRDISRESISQHDLKRDAGVAVRDYARNCSPAPAIEESDRCWTLGFTGMHIDVLPSLVDPDSMSGVLITDRAVHAWQQSDPRGYASWFLSRIQAELIETREELAKNTDVEDVPALGVKSVLQRVVQALKRHRDIYFTRRLSDRPSSIIITTLAAMAYESNGRADIYDSLRQITREMPSFIESGPLGWHLANPAQSDENFMDYWNEDPRLATNFQEWMDAAVRDFEGIGATAGMHNTLPRLGEIFGERAQEAAIRGVANDTFAARIGGNLSTTVASSKVAARSVKSHGFFGGSA